MRLFWIIPALIISVIINLTSVTAVHAAVATQAESFNLRYRPAEDIIPLIKPFLHPEGAISGDGYRLIIQTTGSNMNQLRDIITELDIQLKTLKISISTDRKLVEEQQQVETESSAESTLSSDTPGVQKIVIEKGPQHKVTTRVFSTAPRKIQPAAQQVKLLEGQWAMINTGSAVPYTQRQTNPDGTVTETVHYYKRGSGFKVRAHTSGDKVYLTVRPQFEQENQEGGGKTVYQNIDTSITARLNEWVELGGSYPDTSQKSSGKHYSIQHQNELVRGIFIRVEIVN